MRLFDMLGRKSPSRILELFLERPSAELQMKGIAKMTGLAKLSVLKWTRELERNDILSRKVSGRTGLYTLSSSPSVRFLRIFYNVDYVSNRISAADGQIFLYGSFARGDNTEKSDIDLLVIGKDRNIIKKLKSADDRIKVSFFTPLEWSMAARKDKAFFDSVEKDKIRMK